MTTSRWAFLWPHGLAVPGGRARRLALMAVVVHLGVLAWTAPAHAAAPGSLTQMAPPEGCVVNSAQSGCAVGRSLNHPSFIALSPDGAFAYVTTFNSASIDVFARDATTGVLTQLSGPAGCVAQNGDGATCADGSALNGAVSVTFSPDGAFAYVASRLSQAIAIFQRNASTGALNQIGCIAGLATAASEGCTATSLPLGAVNSVSMSPDGNQLYAGAFDLSGAISVLQRDTTTGLLTMASCINADGSGGCAPGRGLGQTYAVKASADGASVYSTEWGPDGVASFSRAAGGALTQLTGPAGCTLETGDGTTCADGIGLRGAHDVQIGPGESHVYVASNESDAITVYSRGAGGALTLSQCQSAAALASCQVARGIDGVQALALSPAGDTLHSSSVTPSNALSSFTRNGTSGALTQIAGTDGCVSLAGTGGCQTGVAMDGNGYLTVSPDGRFAYASAAASNSVNSFIRGPRPTASFTVSPNPAQVGQSVAFDASGSSEPGGAITRYEWDLDGDGSFETDGGAAATTSRSYASAGSRTIRLRVSDAAGNRAETTRTLSVGSTAISTTATPSVTLGGGQLTDSATVTGRVNPQAGATVEFRLYGPGDTTCSAAPVFGSTVAYPAGGGAVTSAPYTPKVAGTYRWRAFYSGDANNPAVAGTCNDAGETSNVAERQKPPKPPKPRTADTAAPLLGALSLSPARFRAARAGPSIAARIGSRVAYRLSEPAFVQARVQRALAGRRVGGRCVKLTRSNRRAGRCTRYRTVRGGFFHQGSTGANSFTFTGRVAGRRLAPGLYRLVTVAIDLAANASDPQRARFRVVRR